MRERATLKNPLSLSSFLDAERLGFVRACVKHVAGACRIARSFVRRILYKKRGRLFPEGSLGAASLLRKKTWFSLRSSPIVFFLFSTSFYSTLYSVRSVRALVLFLPYTRDTAGTETTSSTLGRGKHATLFRFERLLYIQDTYTSVEMHICTHPVSPSFIISPLRGGGILSTWVNTRGGRGEGGLNLVDNYLSLSTPSVCRVALLSIGLAEKPPSTPFCRLPPSDRGEREVIRCRRWTSPGVERDSIIVSYHHTSHYNTAWLQSLRRVSIRFFLFLRFRFVLPG